ncbi:DUF4129 domain-containing protein [Halorubrum sp. JWXQ-INN 858]|uniref:DUF4129 domain-containing protein n=1 Tax=Halorubrum sp. JWXQ-INN 858 TaxID=2690782 RepID=UPI0013F72ED3|nr:DUF4129 domain-containing protein [Halorubrum sp. JWXQ-INN 858]MWV65838.1 DUF4129 domain-containing protein [Halorubrum sp. JWXQ-INN 858]
MKREFLVAVLLALLAVVALGIAAATLDSAVTTDGGGFGGSGSAGGIGQADEPDRTGLGETTGGRTDLSVAGVCYDSLREPPALLVLVGLFLLIGWLAHRDTGSLFAAGVVAVTVFLPIGGAWLLLSTCRTATFDLQFSFADDDGDGLFAVGGGGVPGIGGEGDAVSTPEALFLVAVAVALIASVLVLLAAGGDDGAAGGATTDADDAPGTEPDLAAVGRAAGTAADRIESADADNEVYRAWREMTAVLDVDRPASSTPAEFAEAAIAAGVDPEPVDDLTDVFERVRYGGADPTGERERRAVEALRRIEAAHGGEE